MQEDADLRRAFTALYDQRNVPKKIRKMVDNLALEVLGETWVWKEEKPA